MFTEIKANVWKRGKEMGGKMTLRVIECSPGSHLDNNRTSLEGQATRISQKNKGEMTRNIHVKASVSFPI